MINHKKNSSKIIINDKRGKDEDKPKKTSLKETPRVEKLEKVTFMDHPSGEPWTKERIAEVYPDLPEVEGYFVLLRIFEDSHEYLRDEKGDITCIVKPEDFNNREKYLHIVGMVVGIGPEAYNRNPKPWCHYGEWHLVDRYCGHQFTYDGIPFIRVPDEKVYTRVKEPNKVGRI